MTNEQLEQHLTAAREQAEEEQAAISAAKMFMQLTPNFSPKDCEALTNKLQELNLSTTDVRSYQTAYSAVCAESLEFQGLKGKEALDKMPAEYMRQRLGKDSFSRGVDYLLRGENE